MPTRRSYAWVAALLMVFTVYVSVLPFRLQFVPLDAAAARFLDAMSVWPRRLPRANFLANLLLFVPIGFSLAGSRLADRPDRSWLVAAARALVFSVCASLAAEFAQVFAPRRVVSAADVVAQTMGCGLGLLAWPVMGPALTSWLRELQTERHDRLERVLMGYVVLWVFASLAPFDVTIDVEELAGRVRNGSIALVPSLPRRTVRVWWDMTVTLASCIPLGLALLVAGPGRTGPRRAWNAALALAVGTLLTVEVAQVFLRSHAATAVDFGIGVCGAAIGVWMGTRWRPHGEGAGVSDATRWWPWVGLVVSAVLAVGFHWQPFDFALDEDLVRRKLSAISLVPFAGYGAGSDLATLNNLISKVGLAAPVGIFAALVMPRTLSRAVAVMVWIPLSAALFGAIEVGQFFLPTRVPDPTDVAVGVVASVVGVVVGQSLRRERRD